MEIAQLLRDHFRDFILERWPDAKVKVLNKGMGSGYRVIAGRAKVLVVSIPRDGSFTLAGNFGGIRNHPKGIVTDLRDPRSIEIIEKWVVSIMSQRRYN